MYDCYVSEGTHLNIDTAYKVHNICHVSMINIKFPKKEKHFVIAKRICFLDNSDYIYVANKNGNEKQLEHFMCMSLLYQLNNCGAEQSFLSATRLARF